MKAIRQRLPKIEANILAIVLHPPTRLQTTGKPDHRKYALTLLRQNRQVYECKVTSDGASGAAIEC
jgi:hypothetical protein